MANVARPSLKKPGKIKKRVVVSVWLLMALAMGVVTLLMWTFTASLESKPKVEKVTELTASVPDLGIGQVNHIDELHELDEMVHPISFDALVKDLRDYPPEFKDSKYLKKNKGKWTVQVMDVSEHDIITDYLSGRDDRNKFAYFRYRDENNLPRYLLTYGVMASPQLAMGAAKLVDFELPANVRVLPEEMEHYLNIIENYELSQPVRDLSKNKVRSVKLKPAKKELAVKAKRDNRQSQNQEDNTTTNTKTSSTRSQSAANQQTVEPNIKGSSDTSETISVQEKRNVVTPEAAPNNTASTKPSVSSSNAQSTQPIKAANDQSSQTPSKKPAGYVEPQVPAEVQPNQTKPINDKPKDDKPKDDSIKNLIEEKIQ